VAGRDHRRPGRLEPAHPDRPAAPFAINQIVHKSNDRLEHDMAVCAKYKVPIVITSLGARTDINDAVHSWGGVVLHDIINNFFAKKAIEKGADGLIAVAAGAGGHAGVKSPFALVQEIRQWFDGPLALSGAIATGDAVLAAQAMGADFAYIGSAFIATEEARASRRLQAGIVDSNSDDIVYSNLFTGVHGNYLKPSIRAAGLDPDNLPESDPSKMNFGGGERPRRPGRTSGAAARASARSQGRRAEFLRHVEHALNEFSLVHLHGNNWAHAAADGLPMVIELTLVRKDLLPAGLPQRLQLPVIGVDQPNRADGPDFRLRFSEST
jgi:NAD(P)H-dependent flavin oxidoreductase YrpB (nitropropane dioxygenase family)